MKKVLLFLLVFFTCFSVNASVNVKERTKENLGFNKPVNLSDEDKILDTPLVDYNEKVYDFAEEFTDDEIKTLSNKAKEFVNKTNIDLVLVTVNKDIDKEELDEYARNLYNYNDFGLKSNSYKGIELILNFNPSRGNIIIIPFGGVDANHLQDILDGIYDNLNSGKFYDGYNKFIELCTKYYDSSIKEESINKGKDSFEDGIEKRLKQKENNYGVNKPAIIDTYHVTRTPLVDSSQKVYDFSGVFTEEQKETLRNKALDFLEETGIELIIVTIDKQYSDSQIEDFADDFFDYNDFGISEKSKSYDGIVAVRNTNNYNRYYYISTGGRAQLYYDDSRIDKILDDMYDNMHIDDFYSGFIDFINSSKKYYKKGILPKYKGCTVDQMGDLFDKNGNPVSWDKGVYVMPIIPALIISLVVSIIFIIILISRNKMVKKAVDAKDYLDENSVKYTSKQDHFVSTHTSSYRISSSGGGGGSHHSSGGFSHGGGGRHC